MAPFHDQLFKSYKTLFIRNAILPDISTEIILLEKRIWGWMGDGHTCTEILFSEK